MAHANYDAFSATIPTIDASVLRKLWNATEGAGASFRSTLHPISDGPWDDGSLKARYLSLSTLIIVTR
jgi:hypothetical protein